MLGLIPAHAGSTLTSVIWQEMSRAHPRSRGEHRAKLHDSTKRLGSSPLTRGALCAADALVERPGLIPAHAGSTAQTTSEKVKSWAHPRSRGEHSTFSLSCTTS